MINIRITSLLSLLLLSTSPHAESLKARALVTPSQQATLSSPLSDRIDIINVKESSSFNQGDTLIQFQCDTTQVMIDKAQSELEISQRTLQTHLKMQRMESISELEVALSRAQVDQAEAELAITQIEERRCHIVAPFSGNVTKLYVHPFESVKKGGKLIDIVSNQDMRVELHVPSRWLRWLHKGFKFSVILDETGANITAVVSMIAAEINPVSQIIKIHGTILNPPEKLLTGMSGIALFTSD